MSNNVFIKKYHYEFNDENFKFLSKIKIGFGALGWHDKEYISSRFGYITLSGNNNFIDKDIIIAEEIELGNLYGHVVSIGKSNLIDYDENVKKKSPLVGDIVLLGQGTLVYSAEDNTVGLFPSHGLNDYWMNPHSLYKLHSQTIELYIEPIVLISIDKSELPF